MTKISLHQCLFCDQAGKLTHEHLNPDWLRRYIPTTQRLKTHHRGYMRQLDDSGRSQVVEESHRIRPGDPYANRMKIVCGRCNSGWMSQLQQRAKPLLLPMILGQWRPLSPAEQETLATWMTMSVIVRETAHKPTATTSRQDREAFRQSPRPFVNWSIWIGKYNDDTAGIFSRAAWQAWETSERTKALALEDGDQVTGLTIGRFFGMAFSSQRNVGAVRLRGSREFGRQHGIVPIWPIEANSAEPVGVLDWITWQTTTLDIPIRRGFSVEIIPTPAGPMGRVED